MLNVSALLLDLDGTVYQDGEPLPGAVAAVRRLRAAGLPIRFVTNTTRVPRRVLVERLRRMGIPAETDELFTAPLAAASYLRERGVTHAELCVPEAALEDMGDVARGSGPAQAVVVGDLGPGWSYERLNRAFRLVLDGAELVALQKNRYWQTADGLALDAGPFVAALEFATGRTATVVGKPSKPFFEAVARSAGAEVEHVAMVGDDVVADVLGAQAAGAAGVLVRTGKFRPADLEHPAGRPDHVIAGLAQLPDLLGLS